MRVLAGGIKCVLIVAAAVVAHRDARLHRVGHQTVVHQFQRGDMGGVVKGLVHRILVFLDEPPVVAQVAGQIVMHLGRAVLHRFLHVDDGGQFVDIDDDRLGGVPRLPQRFGHNGGDGFAHVADLSMGQHRMARLLHRVAVPVRDLPAAGNAADGLEIRTGKDADDARHPLGFGGVDIVQRAMRHVRAQEEDMGLPPDIDVVGVVPGPCQEPYVFAPLAAGTNSAVFRHDLPPLGDRTCLSH